MSLSLRLIVTEDRCAFESQTVFQLYSANEGGRLWLEKDELVWVKGSAVALWPKIIALARDKSSKTAIFTTEIRRFDKHPMRQTYEVEDVIDLSGAGQCEGEGVIDPREVGQDGYINISGEVDYIDSVDTKL
ncbi:hypothetical protein NP233_g328 [Leucocoprinus birnbaumii]|uniref:Uncharacterized protein n=1 Tax=Leucocoprinus birnbaumii TaxID=56174 RepID=A0AAD5YYQ1_9AGAR|nr:hypothetical protein NP233_g328 [Leucocoprinus birnbaumii]